MLHALVLSADEAAQSTALYGLEVPWPAEVAGTVLPLLAVVLVIVVAGVARTAGSRVLAALVGVAGVTVVAAVAAVVWGSVAEGQRVDAVVEQFVADHPGLTLNAQDRACVADVAEGGVSCESSRMVDGSVVFVRFLPVGGQVVAVTGSPQAVTTDADVEAAVSLLGK